MARRYAKGRHAVAECQRSGQKMRYRDLVEDGHIEGLLVHPDWWEPKHPQEIPVRVDDPVALYRPSPEISIETDYGNPEAPTPVPTDPVTSDPNTTVAVTMNAGDTQVVLDEPLTYIIGEYVFIALDGGGWFVSLITSTADSPQFTVPFTTPFDDAATVGNQIYIGSGYSLATTTFTVTLGQFSATSNRIGCQALYWDATPVGIITPAPPLLTADNGLITAVGEMADYEAGFATQPDGGFELFLGASAPGADPLALLSYETYSTIEVDHSGGTLVLDTRDIGSGGDLDQGGSVNGPGGGSWWFPSVTKVWFDADIGLQYQVRFVP